MKILELISSLKIGGMERFVLDLSQELGKRHEVILGTLYSPSDNNELKIRNPSFLRYDFSKKKGLDLSLFIKLTSYIRKIQPDIVHTHMMPLLYVSPIIFMNLSNAKFVHTLHNVANHEINEIDFLKKRLYGKRVTTVSISNEVLTSVHDYWPGIVSPLIENGAVIQEEDIDEAERIKKFIINCKKNHETKIVVNVAHVSRSKNQMALNEAAHILYNKGKNISFLVIGRVSEDDYFQEINKNKAPNLYFYGQSKSVTTFFKVADFFCLSSLYEGLPISLLEAMGVGCIPVCTPVGGTSSIIRNNVNGFLASGCSGNELAIAFEDALAKNISELNHMKVQLQLEFNEKYSMSNCGQKYESLFIKLKNK